MKDELEKIEIYGLKPLCQLDFAVFGDFEDLMKQNKNITFDSDAHQGELNILNDGSYIFITNDPLVNNTLVSIDEFLDSQMVLFGGKFKKIEYVLKDLYENKAGCFEIFCEARSLIDKYKKQYDWVTVDNRDY